MAIDSDGVAVVTGAASGIGLGLARRLAERGLHVVLSDVEAPALESASDALRAEGADVLAVVCDVSRLDNVKALADATLERFSRVDVVCNNAGVFGGLAPMWDLHHSTWEWTLRVNLWGVIHGIEVFVPLLVGQNRGHVINTASQAGVSSPPFNGPYNATKHAVVALSETLRAELDAFAPGVGVSVICPSAVQTRVQNSARNRPADLVPPSGSDGTVLLTVSEPSERDRRIIAAATAAREGLPPEVWDPYEYAGRALEAIDAGRLYVAPGQVVPRAAHLRAEALLRDLDATQG
jgi:NAD(P)-dependent dehydrogenase (short-subunit alcohol dehydrogenase family)